VDGHNIMVLLIFKML